MSLGGFFGGLISPQTTPRWARTTAETPMSELLLALFAGILTIAAPCTWRPSLQPGTALSGLRRQMPSPRS